MEKQDDGIRKITVFSTRREKEFLKNLLEKADQPNSGVLDETRHVRRANTIPDGYETYGRFDGREFEHGRCRVVGNQI